MSVEVVTVVAAKKKHGKNNLAKFFKNKILGRVKSKKIGVAVWCKRLGKGKDLKAICYVSDWPRQSQSSTQLISLSVCVFETKEG